MIPLTLLPNDGESRVARDRLELLTALISAPGFDPRYRNDIIAIPRDHPVYGGAASSRTVNDLARTTMEGCANDTINSGSRPKVPTCRWALS